MFSARDLREMEVAETLVPFGEYAENLRAMYIGAAIMASQRSEEAGKRMREISDALGMGILKRVEE